MSKNKIIITGGLGFIGTNLISALLKKNYHIINFDKNSTQSNSKFLFFKDKKYKFIKIDLAKIKPDRLNKLFQTYKPKCIINLASETHVDRSIDAPSEIIKSNILSLTNLALAIERYNRKNLKKIKFLHVGTDEIYGDIPLKDNKFFKESSPLNPKNPYSASKASQLNIIRSFHNTYNLEFIIINPSNNFGPYQFPEKLIPKSIELIKSNKFVEIYGDGKNIRNWIYVENTVNAIIKIMVSGKKNESYNVASSDLISNKDIIDRIYHFMNINKKKIKNVPDRPGHDRKYASSSYKIRKLGWSNKISFDEGIKKTILWYLDKKNIRFFNSNKIILKRLGKLKK
jgi:dTDP-glucose 4,6-dehydratase